MGTTTSGNAASLYCCNCPVKRTPERSVRSPIRGAAIAPMSATRQVERSFDTHCGWCRMGEGLRNDGRPEDITANPAPYANSICLIVKPAPADRLGIGQTFQETGPGAAVYFPLIILRSPSLFLRSRAT